MSSDLKRVARIIAKGMRKHERMIEQQEARDAEKLAARHERGCLTKRRFATWEDVYEVVGRYREEGTQVRYYKCAFCDGYHLTKLPYRKSKQKIDTLKLHEIPAL